MQKVAPVPSGTEAAFCVHFVSSDLEDGTAGGVDLVFVVAAAGFKFHIVYQPAVVLVQADLQIPHIGQGQPGVGQGDIPGLVGGEGSGGAAGGVEVLFRAQHRAVEASMAYLYSPLEDSNSTS